uniref:DNA (cytosine-5-)-methyltransferase n=1 Tax=Portunus trituberculatus TaxID=210409 RepID=A0A3Q8VJ24_PORTR|nr:DNA-methyltransferase 3b [Portunus trituberculatus]
MEVYTSSRCVRSREESLTSLYYSLRAAITTVTELLYFKQCRSHYQSPGTGPHPSRQLACHTRESPAAKMKVRANHRREKTPDGCLSSRDHGRLVWGKTAGSHPWPGIIVPHYQCGLKAPPAETVCVFWFGDNRVSQLPLRKVSAFRENFGTFYIHTRDKVFQKGITACLQELQHQSGLPQGDSEEALEWAEKGFPGATDYSRHAAVTFSPNVEKHLGYVRKAKHFGGCSDGYGDCSSLKTASAHLDPLDAEEHRKWTAKASLLELARQGERDVEQLCIACHRTECQVAAPHPYFVGGVCATCKLDLDENSKDMEASLIVHCVVCASPGRLLICDSPDCGRMYCTGCVELLVAPSAVRHIVRATPWHCFLCEPFSPHTHGLLKPRPEWTEMICGPEDSWMCTFEEVPDPSSFPKKPLRVLSLFDGIATGLVALDKLGLEVEVYYSCETDKKATTVVNSNYRSCVTLLGPVQKLTTEKVKELCPINLLIGGPPCNDLSLVNPKRKGLFDFSGTGHLLLYFNKILMSIKSFNKETHLFWMFENVKNMPKVYKENIRVLEKLPVVIDARHLSPQSRPRYFWGNIPGMSRPIPSHPEHNHDLHHYIAQVPGRKAAVDKVNCITTQSNSLQTRYRGHLAVRMDNQDDVLWITEIEKIFGLPPHYTDNGNLTLKERQKLLGQAWSVPVICHIFQPLCEYFSCRTLLDLEPPRERTTKRVKRTRSSCSLYTD